MKSDAEREHRLSRDVPSALMDGGMELGSLLLRLLELLSKYDRSVLLREDGGEVYISHNTVERRFFISFNCLVLRDFGCNDIITSLCS